MTHTLGKAGTRYNLWEYSDLRIREKDFEVAIINMLKEVKVTTVKEVKKVIWQYIKNKEYQ